MPELTRRQSTDAWHIYYGDIHEPGFVVKRHAELRNLLTSSLKGNGFAKRLIGSIRRECVDHVIVLGEVHLRQILQLYARYYNDIRTHRSLDKDAPVSRQIQRIGNIKSHAILGGLHHHYARA